MPSRGSKLVWPCAVLKCDCIMVVGIAIRYVHSIEVPFVGLVIAVNDAQGSSK